MENTDIFTKEDRENKLKKGGGMRYKEGKREREREREIIYF